MKNIIIMLSLFSSIAYAQNLYQYKDNSGQIFLTNKSNNGNFSAFTQIDHAKDVDVSDFFNEKSETDFRDSKWTYRKTSNEVERTYLTLSMIKSTNAVNLGIGQGGNQNLQIIIKNSHDTGFYNDEIVIGHDSGLVEVCMNSCYMRARFDDDEARWYQLDYFNPHAYSIAPSENYSDVKMHKETKLKEDDYFLLKLYNSNSLVLNFPNFDGTNHTYRFNLKGLNQQKMGNK
ncbi:hypothetical protein [Moraxella catarrhalis]|uniref:hypothetical protein n=1 Tax=Moraxella catarrhalis TaxID=480 RepID=UPI0007E3B39D|nr:hypothetical protein [Moraxella catarrhalis]MPY07445.1 hypothetical protein [Moraxella catarrhalis]OAV23732.1 hypothetical protein AO371_1223 [Moraxella catarrhalis]